MRKRLKNIKNKNGHSDNGAPAQLIAEARLRERRSANATGVHFDSEYSGWSHATRPKDQAISLRSITSFNGPT
jgi:hypothetical protein